LLGGVGGGCWVGGGGGGLFGWGGGGLRERVEVSKKMLFCGGSGSAGAQMTSARSPLRRPSSLRSNFRRRFGGCAPRPRSARRRNSSLPAKRSTTRRATGPESAWSRGIGGGWRGRAVCVDRPTPCSSRQLFRPGGPRRQALPAPRVQSKRITISPSRPGRPAECSSARQQPQRGGHCVGRSSGRRRRHCCRQRRRERAHEEGLHLLRLRVSLAKRW